jgi:hypothetical protein
MVVVVSSFYSLAAPAFADAGVQDQQLKVGG